MTALLFISTSPNHPKAKQALQTAKQLHSTGKLGGVFFYGDGAYHANRLMWQSADVYSVADDWVAFAKEYDIDLPVCVSTALARGITDDDNAKRHQLTGENIRTPFRLVGLSELALAIHDDTQFMQF